MNHVCMCLKYGPCVVRTFKKAFWHSTIVLTLMKVSWQSTTEMRYVGSESRVRVTLIWTVWDAFRSAHTHERFLSKHDRDEVCGL